MSHPLRQQTLQTLASARRAVNPARLIAFSARKIDPQRMLHDAEVRLPPLADRTRGGLEKKRYWSGDRRCVSALAGSGP